MRTCAKAACAVSGFTLLELLVVLLIAATAVAVIGARFDLWNGAVMLKTDTQRLASVLRGAQSRAVLVGRVVSVHIDPSQARYWSDADDRVYRLAPGSRLTVVTPLGRAAVPAQATVRFYPSGDASGLLLHMSDGGGRVYGVQVSGLTGRVRFLASGALVEGGR